MYQGSVVELPVGIDGLNGTHNVSEVRPSQLLQALNITYENGTLQKEGGSALYNTTPIAGAPDIIGGTDWWPNDGVQRMVVMGNDGKLYKDSGGGTFPTTLKSGMTATNVVPTFIEGGKEAAANNRKLFIFTGSNPVQVLSADGATTTDLATPPADWSGANQPISGANHAGRLWGWGNLNDPHRVYFSDPVNHESFTGGGSLSIFPGDGERIITGVSFKGLLILWKRPTGAYFVDTTNTSILNWTVRRIGTRVGMQSPAAFCISDDDVLYMDQNGNIQFLSATIEFGDITSRNLSTTAQMNIFFRDNLALGQLPFTRAIWYGAKREAHFAVAAQGSTVNDRRIVVDFNRPDLPRFRFSDKDTCDSLWTRKDANNVPRPTSGDNIGQIWQLDQATKSKNAVAYTGKIQTGHDDLSTTRTGQWIANPTLATKRKLGDFLEALVEPTGNWNMTVEVLWDGKLTQTLIYNMGVTGATLGNFVLGTSKLAGPAVLSARKRLTGTGRRISLIISNSGPGEDFSVARFFLSYRLSDERAIA